jgi:hypothetical protein
VFDGSKLSFYAAMCYTWLGEADRAEEHAQEVVARSRLIWLCSLPRVVPFGLGNRCLKLHPNDVAVQRLVIERLAWLGADRCITIGRPPCAHEWAVGNLNCQ